MRASDAGCGAPRKPYAATAGRAPRAPRRHSPQPLLGGTSSPPRFPAALELPGSPFVQCPVFSSDSLPLPLPALHLAFLAFLAGLAGLGVSTTFVGLDGGQSPVASATGASPPSPTVAAIAAAVI